MFVHGPEENDMIKYWYIIKSYSKFNNSTTIRSRNPMIWQRNKNLLGLGREFIKKMIIPSQKYWLADILKGHVDPIKKKDTLIGKGERRAILCMKFSVILITDSCGSKLSSLRFKFEH